MNFDPSRIRILMNLWLGSSLIYCINMRGGGRGTETPTHHHVTTLATTFPRPNPETLVAHDVLAHPRVIFHSVCPLCRRCCGCCYVDRLRRCGGCCRDDHEKETIVIDYFFYTVVWLRWIAAPTLLPLHCAFSINHMFGTWILDMNTYMRKLFLVGTGVILWVIWLSRNDISFDKI
jgi:hypothetical protein